MPANMSSVAKRIKEILDRKVILEDNIANMECVLGHVDLSNTFTAWTVHNTRIDFKIEKALMFDAISLQLVSNKEELSEINKKLDAIHALMTM